MSSIQSDENFTFLATFSLLPANAFNLNQSKILLSGKELILPKQQIVDFSKLKEFADDIFKFDEKGKKFSKQVENTVGKREIACYEDFYCRQVKNQGLFGKGLMASHEQ